MTADLRAVRDRLAACETYEQARAIFLERLRLGKGRKEWPAELALLNARGAELYPDRERRSDWERYVRD